MAEIDTLIPYWPGFDPLGYETWSLRSSAWSWCCLSNVPPDDPEDHFFSGYGWYASCEGTADDQAMSDAWFDWWQDIGNDLFGVASALQGFTFLSEEELDTYETVIRGNADTAGEFGQFVRGVRRPVLFCPCVDE